MSAINQPTSTAYFFISAAANANIAEAVRKNFSAKNCRVIIASATRNSQEEIRKIDAEINQSSAGYLLFFAPEVPQIAESEEFLSEVISVFAKNANSGVKASFVFPEPSQYALESNQTHAYEKHLQSLNKLKNDIRQNEASGSNFRTVLYQHALSNQQDAPFVINQLIRQLPEKIVVTGSNDLSVSPILPDQVAEQVVRNTFKQHSKGEIYCITGTTKTPLISLAYQLSTLADSLTGQSSEVIQIETSSPAEEHTIPSLPPTRPSISELFGDFVTRPQPNPSAPVVMSEKIPLPSIEKRVVRQPSPPTRIKKSSKTSPKLKPKASPPKKKAYKIFSILIFTILLFCIVTPTLLGIFVSLTFNSFKQNNPTKAYKHANTAHFLIQPTKKILKTAYPITRSFGLMGERQIDLLDSLEHALSGIEEVSQIQSVAKETFSLMIGNQAGDIFSRIDQLQISVRASHQSFSKTKAIIESVLSQNPNSDLKDQLTQANIYTSKALEYLSTSEKILSASPTLIGESKRQTYAILLQNNTELRATGGFIGSFALITFDKGRLLDIETFDVYDADGQLRGHVEPPAALKTHLGEANWYLRDSNWDPNFPTTARRVEWFLDKELNRQIDGVIGINLYVVQDLLTVFGGLELSDYQEVINSDNLFQRAEYHSEINYFDGSTQKKDFIASLINAMYLKISELSQEDSVNLFSVLFNNANNSQIQVSVKDESAESLISDTKFSGQLLEASCQQITNQGCIADYLSIIETNVGVNKVNYFINRQISHQVKFTPANITETLNLSLENTAQSAAWPAGTYKNYLRVMVPQGASLVSVSVDGNSLSLNQVDISNNNNKTIFGLYLEVPINEKRNLEVVYKLNQRLPLNDSASYQLTLEKQSGTTNDPITTTIFNPNKYTPVSWNPQGQAVGDSIVFSTTNTTDQHFSVSYIR